MKKFILIAALLMAAPFAALGQQVISQASIIQWTPTKPAGNPPFGYIYMYFDSTSNALTCVNYTGSTAACNSLPTTSTANQCLLSTGTAGTTVWGACSGSTSANWSSIVPGTGTITAGTFNVGTGSTLTTTGSGLINASQLLGSTWASPAGIGSSAPASGAFTTLSASGQITSTLAIGTSPFAITSTTVVPNLNVSQLLGSTWVVPGTIGSTTPNTGAFTTLAASSTVSGTGFTNYFASPPAIGGTAPAAGAFTTLSAMGNLTTNMTGGPFCVHETAGVLSATASDCGSGGGGGSTLTVNGGSAITSPNLQNGSAVNGQTINVTQSVSNITFAVTAGSILTPTGGGTGQNLSSANGVLQFSSGVASASSTLANGTVAITQSPGDGSADVATDAFVGANPVSLAQINNGAAAAGQIPCVNSSATNLTWLAASIGNFLYTNSSGNCAFDSLLSESGTTLTYSGTGGITASKFTLTGPYYMTTVPIAGAGTPAAVGSGNSGEAVSGDGNLYNSLNNAGWGQIAAVPGGGASTVTAIAANQFVVGASAGVWKTITIPNCATGLSWNNSSITMGCSSTSTVQFGNGFSTAGGNGVVSIPSAFYDQWTWSGQSGSSYAQPALSLIFPINNVTNPYAQSYEGATAAVNWTAPIKQISDCGFSALASGTYSTNGAAGILDVELCGTVTNVFTAGVPNAGTTSIDGVKLVASTKTLQLSGAGHISADEVNGAVVPASTGLLGSNSSRQFVATTAAQVATLIQGLTGCNTATNVFTPQASDCVAPTSGVTSIATTSPITGGTITTTGTIACATCVTSGAALTSTAIMTGAGLQGSQTPNATATLSSGGVLAGVSMAASLLTALTSNLTLGNGNNTLALNSSTTSNSQSAVSFGETAAATGTGDINVNVQTLATSTALPLQVTSRGTANGVNMTVAGLLQAIGSGGINATQLGGFTLGTPVAGGIGYGVSTTQVGTTAAGTAGQVVISGGTSAPTMIDFPERFYIPSANCNNTTAGAGWNIGASGVIVCRGGTNNLGGAVQITDTAGTFAQTPMITIPVDWDTATRPYIKFYFSVVTDTTNGHTVIPQVKVSCPTAGNGTTTDDATFSAAQSSSTVTLGASAIANGYYNGSSVQIGSTQMTGCIAGGAMIVQIGRATDTVTGNVNFWGVDITFPRLIAVQAN